MVALRCGGCSVRICGDIFGLIATGASPKLRGTDPKKKEQAVALSLRQNEILEIARPAGRVVVEDMAQRLDETLQTIRRDLSAEAPDDLTRSPQNATWSRMNSVNSLTDAAGAGSKPVAPSLA